MNTVSYSISGINNKQMKTALKNALDKIQGVQEIDIDISQKTIEVGFNNPADETQIKDCIIDSGFKLS